MEIMSAAVCSNFPNVPSLVFDSPKATSCRINSSSSQSLLFPSVESGQVTEIIGYGFHNRVSTTRMLVLLPLPPSRSQLPAVLK